MTELHVPDPRPVRDIRSSSDLTNPARTEIAPPRALPDPPPPNSSASTGDPLRPQVPPHRASSVDAASISFADAFDGPPPADRAARLTEIRADLGDCTRCKLHRGRTKIVFGVGNPEARLMFVGEGPGQDEDLKGEPFVGRAGKKLDEMIGAIKLSREEVYIANVVKCRPPNNRDPELDEVERCSPFLFEQIEAIRPRVIVTLGGPATALLLRTKIGITKLRGNWQQFRGIPVMPTFHPAYLLRNYTLETRRRVFDDLLAARAKMDEGH